MSPSFPATRMRRLRATRALRGIVRETVLTPAQLVLPLFVDLTADERRPVPSMPGVGRLPLRDAANAAAEARALGVAMLLFGIPEVKDARAPARTRGTASSSERSPPSRTRHPELLVMTDVCLCEYTDHGHCGVLARRRLRRQRRRRSSCSR